MELNLVTRSDEIVQVELIGRLDVDGLRAIDELFQSAIAERQKSTIVDLSQVPFIASLAMGMFIQCAQKLRGFGEKLVFLSPQLLVGDALKAVGIDQAIPILDSIGAAEEVLQGKVGC